MVRGCKLPKSYGSGSHGLKQDHKRELGNRYLNTFDRCRRLLDRISHTDNRNGQKEITQDEAEAVAQA
jgi:hypothetical protein